ncbi:MAG: hypothetical protein L3K08_09200, partial [Thermoplasmata archaeon]|nr:hypothetical protein [Thermoplasmata archaeon]
MTPDRSPRRRHRPSTTPPTAEDLEGYLVGVERRVAERKADGTGAPSLEADLARARSALRGGDLVEADRRLRDLDERLDAILPEVEMTDRPRGLVGFRTVGDPGVPLGREEDPIANRLLLVGRLATIRDSQGIDVREARRLLAEAEAAYRDGDRP